MFGKAINGDNDIYISNGSFATVDGRNEVAQLTTTRLRSFLGEWFLNTSTGVNYYGIVFATPIDLAAIDNEFRSIIINTTGVNELTSYSSTVDSAARLLKIEFTATSIYGQVSVSETINV